MEKYLQEIGRYPILTREQERQATARVKEGDFASRDLLINSNLRLVVTIARKYSSNGLLDDLVGEGNEGLVKAVDKFNPDLGHRFPTYAGWWIKNSILSFLEGHQIIRLPPEKYMLRRKIYSIITDHLGNHLTEPTPEQIAQQVNKTSKKQYSTGIIKELLQTYESIRATSLNMPVGEEDSNETIDLLVGSDGRDDLKLIDESSIEQIINNQMTELNVDDLTRTILEEVLYNYKSQKELVEITGLSKEQIRQKYSQGIRLLKHALRNNSQLKDAS